MKKIELVLVKMIKYRTDDQVNISDIICLEIFNKNKIRITKFNGVIITSFIMDVEGPIQSLSQKYHAFGLNDKLIKSFGDTDYKIIGNVIIRKELCKYLKFDQNWIAVPSNMQVKLNTTMLNKKYLYFDNYVFDYNDITFIALKSNIIQCQTTYGLFEIKKHNICPCSKINSYYFPDDFKFLHYNHEIMIIIRSELLQSMKIHNKTIIIDIFESCDLIDVNEAFKSLKSQF